MIPPRRKVNGFWSELWIYDSIEQAALKMRFDSDRATLDRILNTPQLETYTKFSCHGTDAEYPTEEGIKYHVFDERGNEYFMYWYGDKKTWNKIDWWLKKEV